jgi:uncharacterized protein (DUF697 family)
MFGWERGRKVKKQLQTTTEYHKMAMLYMSTFLCGYNSGGEKRVGLFTRYTLQTAFSMALVQSPEAQKADMVARKDPVWTLIPASQKEIDEVRTRCRKLVQRRAAVSAGIAVVPIPGLDVVSDIRLFADLIDEINHAFGLTPEQIGRMRPKFKLLAYETAVSVGGAMVGKYMTREAVLKLLLQRGATSLAARQATRLVPLAGQAAAAAVGFFAFRQIGYAHVEACARVAQELMTAQ